jgi:hypothetical protein
VADGLALDGVIRSDNRGSESLFPLYVAGENGAEPNFAPAFIEQFASHTQMQWMPLARGDLQSTFGAEDLAAYIYAVFHAPSYRQRYADELRTSFPRVLPPSDGAAFTRMAELGRELIELHLLREPHSKTLPADACGLCDGQYSVLGSRYRDVESGNAALATADFRVGGYAPLKKWLQPKHRSPEDLHYHRIAAAIARTQEIMQEVDAQFMRSLAVAGF